VADFGNGARNEIALLPSRGYGHFTTGGADARIEAALLLIVGNVPGRRQRDRRDRLAEQVAFLAEPNTLDVVVGYRGHGHRLAAGFQEYDIAGLERHGLSFRYAARKSSRNR
jgi:hypothetical protein